ncbi:pyridoxamine 5'-phosphate oxidase family protein [Mycolicibacterium sp. J2]|uniref:pyridoxamine 5'-phosphate oxidase family protein n=1 Tax=Mycolicibacterium sp. J2 TaxID=2993511 RepID=UPI00224B4DBB|nr:pyridoxamine 5'-phosphate oxidase family protein [Mycolicibacterium sp. J2]MCX2716116.1 pyridoxamine 5'-phosphate oxidase family protein [Mycolicibacterium sp. J2]
MPLPETALTVLRKPNPAVMATVTSDGRPVSVATWYLIEDDGLLMLCMNADEVVPGLVEIEVAVPRS